eukprot:scaffold26236_cov209-Skeletonema_marinoi.AAC.3
MKEEVTPSHQPGVNQLVCWCSSLHKEENKREPILRTARGVRFRCWTRTARRFLVDRGRCTYYSYACCSQRVTPEKPVKTTSHCRKNVNPRGKGWL